MILSANEHPATAPKLILVNENDEQTGTGEKLYVHQHGILHRAFSILTFNSVGDMLLQKRADCKYHSAGLWSNTCCSHAVDGEAMEETLHRRLIYEMGFDCPLQFHHKFIYRVEFPDVQLIEHEVDHVYVGTFDGIPAPDPEEASEFRWILPAALREEMRNCPQSFTFWFRLMTAAKPAD